MGYKIYIFFLVFSLFNSKNIFAEYIGVELEGKQILAVSLLKKPVLDTGIPVSKNLILTLYDKRGTPLYSKAFDLPTVSHGNNLSKDLLTVPFITGASQLSAEIDRKNFLFSLEKLKPTKTIDLKVYLSDKSKDLRNKIKFVALGQGYKEVANFKADAEKVFLKLVNTMPFSEHKENLKLDIVDESILSSFDCKYSGRVLSCNNSSVKNFLAARNVSYDKIFIIVDSKEYGGSGGTVSVVYNGDSMEPMFLHEMGHSFAGLLDEYVSNEFPEQNISYPQFLKNCITKIDDTMNLKNLYQGCSYATWYRTSDSSVMRSLLSEEYNDYSIELIEEVIAEYLKK